ncbi:hypothetical protein AB0I28_00375 [Phytomonospora sp. NPDC050363]|uniref:hypothetical protein n=1 Tax=Phytomonospora sp. NPDC050363 TaxID=3155642 RepID=UPI0033CFB9C8
MGTELHIDPIRAVEHLFTRWLPHTRLSLIDGEAPASYVEDWTTAPSPEEVSRHGSFPATFPVPGGRRHPLTAERFDVHDPAETSTSPLHASWGVPDNGARRAYELIIGALETRPGALDRRGRALAGLLAGYLTADATDLLRINVAAEPGGPALDGELHLLARSGKRTTRLALIPAVDASPVEAAPEHRIACAATLLAEFLRINNTDTVTFDVALGTHGADLDVADPDAAFRAAWTGTDWAIADDEDDGVLRPVGTGALEAALTESEENLVAVARAQTLLWEFDADMPEIPGDELVSHLARDLLETIVTETTGSAATPPVLAYAGNLPLASVLEGEGDSVLLLVGAHRTALVHIAG